MSNIFRGFRKNLGDFLQKLKLKRTKLKPKLEPELEPELELDLELKPEL